MQFSGSFVNTVIDTWGEAGALWLRDLPALILYCENKWGLFNLEIHHNLSYNCILFANRKNDSSKVILKLTPPNPQFVHEIHALRIYKGRGAVKLLEYDFDKGAMIMEAITPGTSLTYFFPEQDEQAVAIAVTIMQKLHVCKLPSNQIIFPTIEEWLKGLHSHNGNFPEPLIQKAIRLSSHLLKTQSQPVLLHGDLHYDNILLNNDAWVSIDPKGVIGESAYEVGAFIRNPMPKLLNQKNPKEIISQKLEQFSSLLKVDRQRLTDWSFIQTVLAACWAYEDKGDWKQWITCAEIILKLKTNL